jgi:hypothetical protein
MTEPTAPPTIDLARTVRPQRYGDSSTKAIVDPLVEPLWAGVRVIGGADEGGVALFEGGEELTEEPITNAFRTMARSTADAVIVDGYLTKQAHPNGPLGSRLDLDPTTGELLTQTFFGLRSKSRQDAERLREAEAAARLFRPDDVVTFLVTDLLWLDGTWLLDIPLLERRRLLEAVLPGDELVRPGPYVRPPLLSWIGSWRSQGFTGLTFKEANGRYRPGEIASDWATTPMPLR